MQNLKSKEHKPWNENIQFLYKPFRSISHVQNASPLGKSIVEKILEFDFI